MKLLGAIFAGGGARRFGSDKAAAIIGGVAMIDHVAARLRPQCDALAAVGRDWPGLAAIADAPRPGLGPLGALAGALAFARAHGFDAVLTSGCDLPDLPTDLRRRLEPGPAVIRGQPLLGLWPSALADDLRLWLEAGGDQAMRSWIVAAGARIVTPAIAPSNINTRDELAAYVERSVEISPVADPRSSR